MVDLYRHFEGSYAKLLERIYGIKGDPVVYHGEGTRHMPNNLRHNKRQYRIISRFLRIYAQKMAEMSAINVLE